MSTNHYDFIIVGSGFGGSVSALRLTEKGYRVLVIERGRRFLASDFPKTNWEVNKWFWKPEVGMQGLFNMTFMEHVTVLHGTGVGGGSLVYANTLPVPKKKFFEAKSWAHLADWEEELKPFYPIAKRMLGAAQNPCLTQGDRVLEEIAKDMGRENDFHPTDVAVFFGKPGKKVSDPYFNGEGPDRVGCNFCGGCMTGCRFGAKNTLDKNYLYLAEKKGAKVVCETEVLSVKPRHDSKNGEDGYHIETKSTLDFPKREFHFTADKVIFSGGVMGTLPLLLRLKEDKKCLPRLSPRLGFGVRTNSEALIGVLTSNREDDFSKGVAITSILHTDEHSHIEPVRYSKGSGFFRAMALPHAPGSNPLARFAGAAKNFAKEPQKWLKALSVADFAKQTQILLYMRSLEGTLRFKLGRDIRTGFRRGLVTELEPGSEAPSAFMKEATELAQRFADKTDGVSLTLLTETLLGVPSTAHILGGCAMGQNENEGVINANHELFGYKGLYVIDGSTISANLGVNPSLTITALAERAMSKIPNANSNRS